MMRQLMRLIVGADADGAATDPGSVGGVGGPIFSHLVMMPFVMTARQRTRDCSSSGIEHSMSF